MYPSPGLILINKSTGVRASIPARLIGRYNDRLPFFSIRRRQNALILLAVLAADRRGVLLALHACVAAADELASLAFVRVITVLRAPGVNFLG